MYNSIPNLPTDKAALGQIIDDAVSKGKTKMAWKWGIWHLTYLYLMGYRVFKAADSKGSYFNSWELEKRGEGNGAVPFRLGEFLRAVNDAQGLLSSMDLSPHISPRSGASLQTLRESAIGNVISSAILQPADLENTVSRAAHVASTYGMCGLMGNVIDHPILGLVQADEVIHPRELFPFPDPGWNLGNVAGIMRHRPVPYSRLKEMADMNDGMRLPPIKDLETNWKQIGEAPQPLDGTEGSGSVEKAGPKQEARGAASKMQYVEVLTTETFIEGPQGTLARYIISSGDQIILDADTSDQFLPNPISIFRFFENGDFYGAGLYDVVFHSIRELELMMSDLARNVREQDRYGILVTPSGTFNERQAFKNMGRRLRHMSITPETSFTGQQRPFNPFVLQPVNSRDEPQKVAAAFSEMISRGNPTKDLIEEKGRGDSGVFMGALQEEANKPWLVPTQNMVRAFAQMHRADLHQATMRLIEAPRSIPIQRLTPDLAGVVINFEEGTVSLQANPIPNFSRLRVGVRQTTAKAISVRKAEALQLFQLHGSLDRLVLHCLKEGIPLEMYLDGEQAAVESVTMDLLALYNDGVTPGGENTVMIHENTVRPDLQLVIWNAFLQSPIMKVASDEVKKEMYRYREALMLMQGAVTPVGMPPLESEVAGPPQLTQG